MAAAFGSRSLDLDTFDQRNRIRHLAVEADVTVVPPASSPYSRGGDAALVDGIRGSIDRRGGDWQGYEEQDFEATIDLGTPTPIQEVKVGFLQNSGSRVFLPTGAEISVSEDGVTFESLGIWTHEIPWNAYTAQRHFFEARAASEGEEPPTARFVRVRAMNRGLTPTGHSRAGEPAWLYVDEIIVR
jgi:hexosaminidase